MAPDTAAPEQVDVEVTFKLVVSVPEGYTQDDVASAVTDYITETGSLPEPTSVVDLYDTTCGGCVAGVDPWHNHDLLPYINGAQPMADVDYGAIWDRIVENADLPIPYTLTDDGHETVRPTREGEA